MYSLLQWMWGLDNKELRRSSVWYISVYYFTNSHLWTKKNFVFTTVRLRCFDKITPVTRHYSCHWLYVAWRGGGSSKDISYRNVFSVQLSLYQCATNDRKNGLITRRDVITQGESTQVVFTPYYVRGCEPSGLKFFLWYSVSRLPYYRNSCDSVAGLTSIAVQLTPLSVLGSSL